MDKNKIAKAAKTIRLISSNKKMFFLVHGYTGSPTDFNQLGNYLHKRFNANVKIMRTVGHGTNISDLDNLNYIDFLEDVETELKKDLAKGMKIVIGGLCLGSLIVFDLAARYPVKGVFSSSLSYKYRFPVNFLRFLAPFMPQHIKKPITNYEKRVRAGSFNYPYVHLRGLKVVSQAKKRLKTLWKEVKAPCVFVHCDWDKMFHYKSDKIVIKKISSKRIKNVVFSSKREGEHNLFYSPYHQKVYKIFGDFFEKNKIFD